MDINKIILSERYKAVIPRPTVEEYEALKQSIREEGISMALVVNSKNVLLDGYTRYQIAQELEIDDLPVEVKGFTHEAEEIGFIISLNLNRRHLNTAQKAEIGLVLLGIEKERARERMLAGKKADPSHNYDQGKALKVASQKVGISHDTLNRARQIKEAAKDDDSVAATWNKALEGKATLNQAYVHVLREKNRKKVASPPKELEPPPTGERKVTAVRWVHEESGAVKYQLRISQNAVGRNIKSLYEEMKEDPFYQEWQMENNELRTKAEALRKEAERLEKLARDEDAVIKLAIRNEIVRFYGPVEPFIETYWCEILDEGLKAELGKLGKPEAEQIAALLLASWTREKLKIMDYGIWGDLMFLNFKSSGLNSRGAGGWHKMGSMDQVIGDDNTD